MNIAGVRTSARASTHAIWALYSLIVSPKFCSRFRCWNLLLNCFTSSQVIYQKKKKEKKFDDVFVFATWAPSRHQQMISSAGDAAMALAKRK